MSHVVVIPRVRFTAWNGEEPCEAPLAEVLPLEEALEREYTADACILMYAPPDPTVNTRFPRLTKAALAYFELEPDEMPSLSYILVDVDYADHEVPPNGWADEILACSPWPCGWYRTPHGLRLIYEPDRPVPINQADSYLGQFHDELQAAGVPSDEATTDWTRLFKAPRCLGLDLPMDVEGIQPIDWHPDELETADAMSIGPIVSRDYQTALDCAPEKITRADLKPLGKSRTAELIYKGRLAAPVGQRHKVLLDAAREIVRGYDTEDPMVPFHLLIASAEAMGKSPAELWRICEWTCAHWSGVRIEREEATQTATREMCEEMDCSPTEVLNRVVIDADKEFFVWDEERMEYSTGYGNPRQLLGALVRHAPNLAHGYYSGKVGTSSIMRDLSTVADRVVYTYCDDGPRGYDKTTYTFYRRICKQDRSLLPKFDADVDRWLRALFGDEADHGLDWLASLPRLDRPTCALYLRGGPSIGKGMLAAGIARIWSRECATTPYAELLGTFNSTLKRSPIIYADEKVPQDVFASNDSSVFRRIIGNSGLPIRDLYSAPATLDGYPRVLITANNEDALAIREELNVADLDAIRIRIGYIAAPEGAAREVLAELTAENGFESTRQMTEGWVTGGRIARHVLHLAENRPCTQGDRLLVEGWDSDLTRSLSTSAGATGVIAEVVALFVADHADLGSEAVRWFDDHIYVNNAEFGRAWKYIVGVDAEKPPNSTRRLKALKALAGESKRRLDVYENGGTRRQLNYWKIPASVIARLAEERNICPAKIIEEAAARKTEPAEDAVALSGFDSIQTAKAQARN